jgi:hypothetical protein
VDAESGRTQMTHECARPRTCCRSIQALEPDDDCPIHSGGEWPPRCAYCGKFLPWERSAREPSASGSEGQMEKRNP